jgi:hypothetical protein
LFRLFDDRAQSLVKLRIEFIFALVGAILLAVAGGLMLEGEPELAPNLRVVLVDASASATRPSPNYSRSVRERLETEAEAAEAELEQLAIVIVSKDVRIAFGPGDPANFRDQLRGLNSKPFDPLATNDSGEGSRIAAGLLLVKLVLAESSAQQASLLIIGDGTYTQDNPRIALKQLITRGLNWRGFVRLMPERTDVALSALELPEQLEPGAPLVGTLRLDCRVGRSNERVWDRVEIIATDREGVRTTSIDVWESNDGGDTAQVARSTSSKRSFSIGPARFGRTTIVARLVDSNRPQAFDPIPENDAARGSVIVGDPLVVGWLSASQLRPRLEQYFQTQIPGAVSIQLDPVDVAATLPELDALFVFDQRLSELPAGLSTAFIRAGGGLFVAGGWRFLGEWSGAAKASEIAQSLPMRPKTSEPGTREVLVLVDGSGSMAGAPFASVRTAVRELVRAAPERDAIELAFFTGALHKRQLLRQTGNDRVDRERLATELLDARVPGGTTQILDSLEQLLVERKKSANEGLVLLLTDGREQSEVFNAVQRAEQLRTTLPSTQTRLVVFAVGEDVNLEFLSSLVGNQDDLFAGDDLNDLGALFGREVNRERVREAGAISLEHAGGQLAQEVFPASVRVADVGRLIRADLSPEAIPVLISELGEPVLAAQRFGLGRTVFMAGLPFADWAPDWEARLTDLTPILRWCARRPNNVEFPSVSLADREIIVRGLDTGLPLVIHGRIQSSQDADNSSTGAAKNESPLLFCLPTTGAGLADPSVRVAQFDGARHSTDRGTLMLELTTATGAPIHRLVLPQRRAAEFEEPRNAAEFPAPTENDAITNFERETSFLTPSSASGARVLALATLAAGALFLFAAGWRVARGSAR